MTAWEKEKVYCARRAQELAAEMEAAIESGDREQFETAYQTSMRYMSAKQRKPLYRKWLTNLIG